LSDSPRPEIRFVPLSTDPDKIRFFGTLMPALLLLKDSPRAFVRHQFARRATPRAGLADFITAGADDAARLGDRLVFLHRWHTDSFDPRAFARARTFLARLTRLLRRQGFAAEPLDPLSPEVNLPRLAAEAGLGDLSPFGLLVHPAFGPRLILTALRTDHPFSPTARHQGRGCTDCLACLERCPQAPQVQGVVELGACQSCALCLAVCPVGSRAP
jgi:ferredoxin